MPYARVEAIKTLTTGTIDQEVLDAVVASDCPGTNKLYESNFSTFAKWFNNNSLGKADFNLNTISKFLLTLKKEGKAFSTINNYKTALQPITQLVLNLSIHENYSIQMLLKKTKKAQRKHPVKLPSWDLNTVLDFLKSRRFGRQAGPSRLFQKTVFLTMLASSRRPSDLAGLEYRKPTEISCNGNNELILFKHPSFEPKNRSLSFVPRPIKFPCLQPHDEDMCPVANLARYVKATADRRTQALGYLFLPVEGGNSKCPPSYIAKATKRLIIEAHRSAGEERAGRSAQAKHLRKLASSLAFHAGKDLEDVLAAAGWGSASAFIRHYLIQKPLSLSHNVVAGGVSLLP